MTFSHHWCKRRQLHSSVHHVDAGIMTLKRKIQRLHEEHSVSHTSHNPVQDIRMFNSTEEDFRGCRWTSGGEISLINGIAQVFRCSKKEARTKLARFMEASPEVNTKRVNLWKFPGAGQRDTPVGPSMNSWSYAHSFPVLRRGPCVRSRWRSPPGPSPAT